MKWFHGIFLCIIYFANADEIFQREVFEATHAIVREFQNRNGDLETITKLFPKKVDIVVDHMKKFFNDKTHFLNEPSKELRDATCDLCVGGVGSLIFDHQVLGIGWPIIASTLIGLCNIVLDKDVCSGAIHIYLNEISWIFDNKGVSAKQLCALVFHPRCGAWEEVNSWDIQIPENKPDPEEPKIEGASTFKVLHLSDVHMDLSYKPGTDVKCKLPVCCMNTTAMADDPERAAGFWGAYECDLPQWTFEDMLWHIKDTHGEEIEYIMVTGDWPAHDLWLQSREKNLAHAKKMVDLVTDVFPDKLVLPSVGNHESFPENSYPPMDLDVPEFSPKWLFSELAEYYKHWFPSEHQETFASFFTEHSYYAFKAAPNLRIIMVNPNACYAYNFWLSYDWEDNNGVLTWLAENLAEAEALGEKVHIISHIPPGNNDCLGAWGRNYGRLIERFENTVTAQFYGHTHNDQFLVFYDEETQSRPLNLGFVTSSVTTYTGMDPSYTIYTLDGPGEGASYRVLDKEVYTMDLAAANEAGSEQRPTYSKLYDARTYLEMESLLPKDYDLVAKRLATDDEYYAKYFRIYNHGSEGHADDKRWFVICKMVTTNNLDERKCEELMQLRNN